MLLEDAGRFTLPVTAGGIVGHQRQGNVGNTQFAGQHRLRHQGHADQRASVLLQPVNFRGCFQPWTLHYAVGAPHKAIRAFGGRDQAFTHLRVERVLELDERALARPVLREAGRARVGVVDQVMRYGDGSGDGLRGDAAHRMNAQNAPGACLGQGIDVGAIVDPMRRDRVVHAVPVQVENRVSVKPPKLNRG